MSVNTKSGQLGLLLWKNWLLQKKKKALTILEIGLPALFAALLFVLRYLAGPGVMQDPVEWGAFTVDSFAMTSMSGTESLELWYTPDNPVVERIMSGVADKMHVKTQDCGFDTEDELLKKMKSADGKVVIGALVFTNTFPSDDDLPAKVAYKIRLPSDLEYSGWATGRTVEVTTSSGPRQRYSSRGGFPGYWKNNFLLIQHAVDRAITLEFEETAAVDKVNLTMKRHPFPSYIEDPFVSILQEVLPLFVMMSFLMLGPNISKEIALEKEHKLKEFMKMMGLGNWQHWLAWFIKYLIFSLLSVILITIMLFVGAGDRAPGQSDPSLVFVFLVLYCVATILFCFAVAACFNKGSSAATAAGILLFANYAPYFYLKEVYNSLELWMKMGTSLLHSVAMSYGCYLLGSYEGRGAGLKWSNFHTPVNPSDGFTMLHVMQMLLVDCILYGLVAWYVDAVKPGSYGQPRPYSFPFQKSYWCGESASGSTLRGAEETVGMIDHGADSHLFEPNPAGESPGIQIRKLTKVFKRDGKTIVAVDELSLDMIEGQITALLGHNGAGKTTTMFMLTGFLPPTEGMVHINGSDIRTSLDKVRSNLGMCPQENILFDVMTVADHLRFFARLKGVPRSEMDTEVTELISTLGLVPQTDMESKQLSGGMKRKLCVGIALVGGSKVLILDEPTSGMDPENRRKMWDILQGQREGRTMILSTHMMDEADFLGDRIAIMARGKTQCCGTSLFLKGNYGVGYHMVIVKDARCAVDQLTSIITSHVPQASMEGNVGAELSYVLPKESSHLFQELFKQLETRKEELGIASFGASITTMEEVFLKVGASVDTSLAKRLQEAGEEQPNAENASTDGDSPKANTHMIPGTGGGQLQMNTPVGRVLQQYRAMFTKRLLHSWRNRGIALTQILLPVIFAIYACSVTNAIPKRGDDPGLELSLAPFSNPVVQYATDRTQDGDVASGLAASYTKFVKGRAPGGVPYVNDAVYNNSVPTMDEYLLVAGQADLLQYVTNYMIAASFVSDKGNTSVVAHFNNEAYHTPAISLSYVDNAILQYFTDDQHEIITTNHPLPRQEEKRAEDDVRVGQIQAFVISINIFVGLSFLVGSFVIFLIKERSSGAKHLQFVSGVHSTVFWAATFSWDLINFMIPCVLMIAVFAVMGIEPFYHGLAGGYTVLTFIWYALAVLPCAYVLSFIFTVPSTGYNWISIMLIFSGTMAVIAIQVVKLLAKKSTAKLVEWICYLIFPNVCFLTALRDIYINHEVHNVCERMIPDEFSMEDICEISRMRNSTNVCCEDLCGDDCDLFEDDYLAWKQPGILRNMVCMQCQCVVYFLIVFLIDSGLFRIIKQTVATAIGRRRAAKCTPGTAEAIPLTDQAASQEDSEVQAERERIASTPQVELLQTDSLVLRGLKKFYSSKLAVDGLSVGVPQGECFGLLGVNGAGKTTTFKMLTGDETLSCGDAWLDGRSVISQIKQAQQKMGYCPQFDALIDQMSVRETLMMYGRLRGIREQDLTKAVDHHIQGLVLEEHADKRAAKLSGGNKRKLSMAMALIGDPPIVFLDEPTTGIDPVARRLIWDMLASVRASGRTLILTTHSMEECEALCTRLAIMVNGQFKCLGSTQALKSKFGQGYTVMARLTPGSDLEVHVRTNELRNMFKETFPGSVLKDLHQGYVHYHIPATTQTWADIFGTMERARQQYDVEDYSVSQTTLEQVFLAFARAQKLPYQYNPSCTTRLTNCFRSCTGRQLLNTTEPPVMDGYQAQGVYL